MVLKRIRQSLSNNEGAAVPTILAIILFVMIGFAALFQYFYTITILNTVHEACSSVAENILVANAEASYQAKRDGYTGVWHLDDEEISDSTVYIDVNMSLAQQLNLVSDGEDLIKMDDERQVYRLHDIQMTIHNPDFQNDTTLLTATLSLIVDVRLNFPLIESYPVSVPVEVSAAWDRKF